MEVAEYSIWEVDLAQSFRTGTPVGAVFRYRSGGGFCMPAHARIILRGQMGGAVSWLYAVDSLDVRLVSGRLRGGFTRLEL